MSYIYHQDRHKPEYRTKAASPGNEDVPGTYRDFRIQVHGTAFARQRSGDGKVSFLPRCSRSDSLS